MKKKYAVWLGVSFLAVCFLTVASLGQVQAKEWKPETKFLTIVSGSVAGSLYPIAAKVAEIVS